MEGGGHVVFGEQRVEVQREHRQHAGQHDGQLDLQERDQRTGPQVPGGVLQLAVDGVEGCLHHAQREGQLDHRVGHHDQEAHILTIVEVLAQHVPHLAVEEGAEGIADQDRGQQPGEQQAGLHHDGALFVLVLEDVVDGHHHDDAGQRRRQGRQHEAEPYAAHGVCIGEHAGDDALADALLAPGGGVAVILGAEEVDQRPVGHVQRLGPHRRPVLEGEQHDHHHGGHVDDEQHIGVDMSQYPGHGALDPLLDQLGLGLADGQVMPLALVVVQHRQKRNGEQRQYDGQQCRPGLREGLVGHRGARQAHDLRVDGVVTQQRRRAHGAQAGDEGHDRQ